MNKNVFDLNNRVALITGGAGLLATEHAIALADYGAKVYLSDFNFAKCEEAVSKLVAMGINAIAVQADVTSKQSWQDTLDTILKNDGKIDILVNNFAYRAITDKFVIVFEGHFKRNYIHVLDVVQAFNLALENESKFKGQIFNVGLSEANISKIELCEEIQNLIPSFTFLEAPLGKDPDQRNYIVSNQKIESFGFKPQITLQDGLAELIKGLPMFNHKPFTNI